MAMNNLAGLYLQVSMATGENRFDDARALLERAREICELDEQGAYRYSSLDPDGSPYARCPHEPDDGPLEV